MLFSSAWRKSSIRIATGHVPSADRALGQSGRGSPYERRQRGSTAFRRGLGERIFRLGYSSAGNLKVFTVSVGRNRARLGRGSSRPARQEPSEPGEPLKPRTMTDGTRSRNAILSQAWGVVSRRELSGSLILIWGAAPLFSLLAQTPDDCPLAFLSQYHLPTVRHSRRSNREP